jgi:hypothetical protein
MRENITKTRDPKSRALRYVLVGRVDSQKTLISEIRVSLSWKPDRPWGTVGNGIRYAREA